MRLQRVEVLGGEVDYQFQALESLLHKTANCVRKKVSAVRVHQNVLDLGELSQTGLAGANEAQQLEHSHYIYAFLVMVVFDRLQKFIGDCVAKMD